MMGVGGGTADLATLRLAGVAGMVGGALSMAVRCLGGHLGETAQSTFWAHMAFGWAEALLHCCMTQHYRSLSVSS